MATTQTITATAYTPWQLAAHRLRNYENAYYRHYTLPTEPNGEYPYADLLAIEREDAAANVRYQLEYYLLSANAAVMHSVSKIMANPERGRTSHVLDCVSTLRDVLEVLQSGRPDLVEKLAESAEELACQVSEASPQTAAADQ
ncbi:hypothetical protein [Lewinella sp. 4G2]|uniref:hypothetical protein n=1 Tax=Lewinella sp. 4G2 TaxID=1803372 RepID=UPI0007B4A3F1|nr:hypothetical protein [Lewinella sp. 4G2]OAV44718.1 hypothetical protein A3850_009540 [Lewinella sp. 4G2]